MIGKDDLKRLEDAARSSGEKIANSGVFMSLFSEDMYRDPMCLMQLSIAILMDKPICVIANQNDVIPKNLMRVAQVVEFYEKGNTDSLQDATRRVVERMTKDD